MRSLAKTSSKQMSLAGWVLTTEPRNIPLTRFTMQRKSFVAAVADDTSGKKGMNSSGKPAQTKTQLTRVWKESKYCVSVHCFFLLPRMVLSLKQLFYNDLVLLHQGWDVSGIFLLLLCPNQLLLFWTELLSLHLDEEWCQTSTGMYGSMYWKSKS